MLDLSKFESEPDELQQQRWPPVSDFRELPRDFADFLWRSSAEQDAVLRELRALPEAHGRFLQESLSLIYGYVFGYHDSPLHLRTDDERERQLMGAKMALEREMLEYWLRPTAPPEGLDQRQAGAYLMQLAMDNPGVYHPFFDHVRDEMSAAGMVEFLKLEAIRNEVVDDEVALIVIGLQGLMKKVMASNLWDECGNGRLVNFHTYWLRRLLRQLPTPPALAEYRDRQAPWFAKITSNSFNMLATRPGYKLRAYGSFFITESWVNPHFERILGGLRRLGMDHRDVAVYFSSHIRIDPHHTAEMVAAFVHQQPVLTRREVAEVLHGAHLAVAAGTRLYEQAQVYFKEKA